MQDDKSPAQTTENEAVSLAKMESSTTSERASSEIGPTLAGRDDQGALAQTTNSKELRPPRDAQDRLRAGSDVVASRAGPRERTVTVARWALQFVMDNACFQDKGPMPEGWRSDEMKRATDSLEKSMEEQNAG